MKQKDLDIENFKTETEKVEDEMLGTDALMKEAQDFTENAQVDFDSWFEISRFDTNFMSDILTLVQPPKANLRAQKTTSFNRNTTGRAGSFKKSKR